MRIFLCGQRSFGVAVCKALIEDGNEIVGVAPAPQDKYRDKLSAYAELNGIPEVAQCDRLVSAYIPENTDLIVSAHSHWLISDKCLERAKYGGIGFHPSLLPRHRGKDAVRWAVHMGDFISGGTVYRLSSKTDGGDIIRQEAVWVRPEWDYHDLWSAIFPVGVDLMVEAVRDIESGHAVFREQDETFATWEPSWDRPRLGRSELPEIGSSSGGLPSECEGCARDCDWCTYNIADPGRYYRRQEGSA